MATETKQEDITETVTRKKRSPIFIIIMILLVGAGVFYGVKKYTYSRHHEETDDAQVEANINPVISRVSGYVQKVYVEDNQLVRKGDTLLVLDQRDFLLALQQAEAAANTAKSSYNAAVSSSVASGKNINTTQAAVAIVNAQIEAAKVTLRRAQQDLTRYENLIKDHAITQQQYEQALATKQAAEKQVQVLVTQRNQASAQSSAAASQTNASTGQSDVAASMIKQRAVDVENAKLHLSYTVITAPETGIVSKVPVQEGQFIQAGASVFSIVMSSDKWVVANFKETQYNKMMEDQKVTVHVDALPKHDFEAVLSSFAPATGAKFSILPPDNASGNFVKVVQRLPVKIEFTNKSDSLLKKLRAGMNVSVDVKLD
ncbi:MAG: HlyD family secretion protein [Ferruginibacter sp.]